MEYGNVLVIGNSGVGKSTLINAVLGKDAARVGSGTSGTTKGLEIYESETLPFRVIDTIGFEPGFLERRKAIRAVKKWSKESVRSKETDDAAKPDKTIHAIWFCVDGTTRKLFPQTIQSLSQATSMWESIPVIVVITKSYSILEREENIQLVYNAFASQKKVSKNLKKVIPVVAETYNLNETAFAAPDGLTELIEATNDLLPEGIKAAERDVSRFKLNRKRAHSHSVVAASAAAGAVVGAVPVPMPDAAILTPLEMTQINALASIYGIERTSDSKKIFDTLVTAGAAGIAAKSAANAIKAIPAINLAASVVNACVAACVVAALGESSRYIFEKIYLGEKSVEDLDWVNKIIDSSFANEFVEKASSIAQSLSSSDGAKSVGAIVAQLVTEFAPTKAVLGKTNE